MRTKIAKIIAPKSSTSEEPTPVPGNGGAVYLSDMTEEEYDEYSHHITHGWEGFYTKVKNLGKVTAYHGD